VNPDPSRSGTGWFRIIYGSWIKIGIEMKSWIRICIKVKIQKLQGLIIQPHESKKLDPDWHENDDMLDPDPARHNNDASPQQNDADPQQYDADPQQYDADPQQCCFLLKK
jgi:hypothetical protein